MEKQTNAEIIDRPSDSNAILNEFIPIWPQGTGKKFNASFPPISKVNNLDKDSIISLTLPKTIYGMVGYETRIYFNNLVICYNKSLLKFSVQCDIGCYNNSYWSVTPNMPGDYPLTINIKDANNRIVGTAETIVKVANPQNGNDQNIVVLIVGDSIMGNAKIADFLQENIIKNGNKNIRFMGSHSGGGAPLAINKAAVEAYGGWQWETFMTRYLDGEEYNKKTKFMKMENGQLIDGIQDYLNKYNAGMAPDIVIFSLGCNDIACANMSNINSEIEKSVTNRTKLLAMCRKAMPNSLFGITLLAPPNCREEAFEINYKGSIQRHQYLYNQLSYVKRTLEDFQDDNNYSIIPIYAGVDELADYPNDNAVHPNEIGQRRFALMLEMWLKNLNYNA